jgi:hypothetical protein
VRRLLIILVLFLVLYGPYGAAAQCMKKNNAFGPGETVTFVISYNWGPIWVDAGEVSFSVASESFLGKSAWHLKATGITYSSYDFFFKVRDYYDSWINPDTFFTHEFRRYIYEGGYTLVNTLRFDQPNMKAYSTTKRNTSQPRFDTVKMDPCSFDMLAAVYYTRTLDISGLSKDTRIPVSVIIDDKIFPIYIRYMGKETVKGLDGKKYRCLKFSAKMVEGTIFRGDEDVLVWVTDDENKVPVYVQAKILVGTVKAYLKEMKGLRNPVSSLVKK